MRTAANKKLEPATSAGRTIPDFNKSPFALKKAERARAFIAKHGLPKDDKPKKGK